MSNKKKNKSLDDHQRDIENIVREKEGKIIEREWREIGIKKSPYFYIKCEEGHNWWIRKDHLIPTQSRPKGSWCPICQEKTMDDHQQDIKDFVREKGGRIIGREWREVGNRKSLYFHIECSKAHKWWITKHNLIPTQSRPNGRWCSHPDCRGKSLEEHKEAIEDFVREKGGRIIDSEWRVWGNKKRPYFHIECSKGHDWWANKHLLKHSEKNPEGTWYAICQDRISAIGTFGHVPLEYFSLVRLKSKGCKAEHEKTLEEGTRPDLIINRDYNFKTNIEAHQNVASFSDDVEKIAVDFTLSLTPRKILAKCFREYQSKNRFLLIVLMRERGILTANYFQNLINTDLNIDNGNKKKIRVVNFESYLDFLDLGQWNFNKTKEENKIESILRETIELCKKSIDSDFALKKLVKLSGKYRELLGN